MGLLDFFTGRDAVVAAPVADPAARFVVIPVERPFVNRPALDAAGLRRGQWVMSPDGVGIITGARIDGLAEVTLQKQDGTTLMELSADDKAIPAVRMATMDSLRAATIEEIPGTRHEGADHLRSFGYVSASEAAQ